MKTKRSPEPEPRVWLEVDLAAIRANFLRIAASVRPAQVLAVLKANAYGLGLLPVARALQQAGAYRFGVAELREAAELLRHVNVPVHILGNLLASEIPEAVRLGVICPVSDLATARLISRASVIQKRRTRIHFLVDTGMGRDGVPWQEAPALVQAASRLPGLEIEGIYTHFANANNPRHPKTSEQMTLFQTVLDATAGTGFRLVHMANSDGINNFPQSCRDMVRTGINLYGVFDLEGRRTYRLKPTLTMKTRLIAARRLPAGSTIGYGCTHTLFRATRVGTVSAGYADGIPLAASNCGHVLLRGRTCPILGRVSMDYINVDLGGCPEARPGDPVVIIGKSRGREITVEDWAKVKQTHPYDIICSLGNRVVRVYRGQEASEAVSWV